MPLCHGYILYKTFVTITLALATTVTMGITHPPSLPWTLFFFFFFSFGIRAETAASQGACSFGHYFTVVALARGHVHGKQTHLLHTAHPSASGEGCVGVCVCARLCGPFPLCACASCCFLLLCGGSSSGLCRWGAVPRAGAPRCGHSCTPAGLADLSLAHTHKRDRKREGARERDEQLQEEHNLLYPQARWTGSDRGMREEIGE